MSLGHVGNEGTIANIDSPVNDKELVCSLWYDISRQTLLKLVMPNFAKKRKTVAKLDLTPPFPFSYAYEYPVDALKIIGIGPIDEKENNYTVENNTIYTNVDYPEGMPLRYVGDVEDVSTMSPEFIILFSFYLASFIALGITQDLKKVQLIQAALPVMMVQLSSVNSQENKPIIKNTSRYKQARNSGGSYKAVKR